MEKTTVDKSILVRPLLLDMIFNRDSNIKIKHEFIIRHDLNVIILALEDIIDTSSEKLEFISSYKEVFKKKIESLNYNSYCYARLNPNQYDDFFLIVFSSLKKIKTPSERFKMYKKCINEYKGFHFEMNKNLKDTLFDLINFLSDKTTYFKKETFFIDKDSENECKKFYSSIIENIEEFLIEEIEYFINKIKKIGEEKRKDISLYLFEKDFSLFLKSGSNIYKINKDYLFKNNYINNPSFNENFNKIYYRSDKKNCNCYKRYFFSQEKFIKDIDIFIKSFIKNRPESCRHLFCENINYTSLLSKLEKQYILKELKKENNIVKKKRL